MRTVSNAKNGESIFAAVARPLPRFGRHWTDRIIARRGMLGSRGMLAQRSILVKRGIFAKTGGFARSADKNCSY